MMPSPLHTLLVREGVSQLVEGNTPFLLADAESCWLVESGLIEVFSVRLENGKGTGARFHRFSVREGQALFGIPSGNEDLGQAFLAVGAVNTRLRKISLDRLKELSHDPALSLDVARWIDGWITSLALGVSKDINPQTELLLESSPSLQVKEGARFRSRRGVLWISPLEGELLYLAMEEIPSGSSKLFPITHESWLQAASQCRVAAVDTASIVRSDLLWQGLETLYATIHRCEAFNKRFSEVDEYNRFKDRAEAGKRAGEKALEQLAAVLRERPIPRPDASDDPLLRACRAVGSKLGIEFVAPPELIKARPMRDPLGSIAKASRVRFRRVTLQNAWWKNDCGPILGYLKGSNAPVALLPASHQSYECHDPRNGSRQPVTPGLASQLEVAAYIFYRPFSDQFVTYWQLLKFGTQGLRRDFGVLITLGVLGGLLSTLPSFALGEIFDTIIPEADRGQLFMIMAGLLVLALSIGIFEFTRGLAVLRIESKMDQDIQSALLDRLFKLPVPFFRQYSAGDLAERANGINEIRETASTMLLTQVLANIFAVFNLGLLFYYSPRLALVALGLIGIALLLTLCIWIFQVRYQALIAEQRGKISGLVLQLVTGITKLRVAGAEMFAFSTWATQFATQRDIAYKARRSYNYIEVFNAAFPVLASAVLFYCVFVWDRDRRLSTGDFLGFIAAFNVFLTSMLTMTACTVWSISIIPLFQRLKPILEEQPEVSAAKLDPGELTGRIELSRVYFRYKPDAPTVLHNLSIEIMPGEFVAIVGPSGSGKSTLTRLLLGFNKPDSGMVSYDGQDLAELDIAAVRRQIGTVLQTSKLMAGDILTNITGSFPCSEAEAWEAARLAGLEEEIRELPMGMRTVIPAGGGVLSGGQIQRLMIARAIISRPRILLFDEATSALDNRTQALVSKSLEALQATRIVIAHRLSTIIHADRILVMQDGHIVQEGTYNQLLHKPGLFSELAKRQLITTEASAQAG